MENWLIWSFEHNAWWGPARRGYTETYHAAGRYTFDEALKIVREANSQGDKNEAMLPEY